MKCDELTPVTREYANEFWSDRHAMVYNAAEVDAAIAELKAENERLKNKMPRYKKFEEHEKFLKTLVDEYEGYVYDWNGKAFIATPYINIFIKGILRALWIARAERAAVWQIHFSLCHNHSIDREFTINGASMPSKRMTTMRTARDWAMIWKKVEQLCKKKAKEYK